MNERELSEVKRRVTRRLRKESHRDELARWRRSQTIASEEIAAFYREKQENRVKWTKPTIGERLRAFFGALRKLWRWGRG